MPEPQVLILSHSGRLTDLYRCSLDFLTLRYAREDRLLRLPPFETLPPAAAYRAYSGSLSFFRVHTEAAAGALRVEPFGQVKSRFKSQHAVMLDEEQLLVSYEHFLELWKFPAPVRTLPRITGTTYEAVHRYEHGYFAGLHTVFPLPGNRAVITATACDAVLVLDLERGSLDAVWRMPEHLYGKNYDLTPETKLHEHYIANDYQTTHVNCAYPSPDGTRAVVSTLIQGAIGLLDLETGAYRELCRGFVGGHGARFNDREEIYLADSPAGTLVFLDKEGRILRRFAVDSRWLHDVQQVGGDLYAFTLADTNELRVYDVATGDLRYRKKFFTIKMARGGRYLERLPFWRGNSTQFLSVG